MLMVVLVAALTLSQATPAPDARAKAEAEWARIQPQLDARRPLLEAYVQVAAGWQVNQNCRFRSGPGAAALTAGVEQNTLRLGAVLDRVFADFHLAQTLLQHLQAQGRAAADGPLKTCGPEARQAVDRAAERSAWINAQLPAAK